MEAYNLAKLQQSAMPMDWGKRDGLGDSGVDSGAVIDVASAENDGMMEARETAPSIKDNEARALLFFLRPPNKDNNKSN